MVETTVERIVPGGAGLAHADGRTLLVGLAAPGDRLRVRLDRRRGEVWFGSIVEVLAPGPGRVEPPCPYFGRCGGCDFQQLAYESQLDAKVGIVRDCLRRIAGIEPPTDIPISPSPRHWDYRTRAEWRHDPGRRLLGYLERDSHRVCDVDHCPIAAPGLESALTFLRDRLVGGGLPADIPEFRAAMGDDGTAVTPALDADGPAELTVEAAGERYVFDPDCFFQTNLDVVPALVAEALRHAAPSQAAGERVGTAVDLYCGVGLFTLPLARRYGRVIGVEGHSRAAAYATRNLAAAGLGHARVDAVRVDRWLDRHAAALTPVAFALLDPPRTGADTATLDGLVRLGAAQIAYVSCDPATQARDLKTLLGRGYALERIALFDMFPQTHHVETVAHLRRIGTP